MVSLYHAAVLILIVVVLIIVVTVPVVLQSKARPSQQSQQSSSTQAGEEARQPGVIPIEPATTVPSPAKPPPPTTPLATTAATTKSPAVAPTADSETNSPTTFIPASNTAESDTSSPTTSSLTSTFGQVNSFTTAGGIDYYHCVAAPSSSQESHHIFLLHGASFDREVWMERTGILEQFCNAPGLRVSALDLPVSTNYQGLKTVIDDVAAQQRQEQSLKPVVLVTPSASGYAIVSWMLASDGPEEWSDMPNYIEAWVPVAPVALSMASDEQIAGSVGVGSSGMIPVLAIYGDEDSGGGRLSERLGRVAGATVVELAGGHPVYLRSENDFVQNILNFIGS